MDYSPILARMSMLARLPQAEVTRLAERQYLHSGQCLYTEGEPPDHLYIVISGRLRREGVGSL